MLPGFIKTEGFPAAELLAKPATRWIVSTPERVAEAIVDAGPGGKAERYVPRALLDSPRRCGSSRRRWCAAPPPAARLHDRHRTGPAE